MYIAAIYLLVFLFLVYKGRFFGLFKDEHLSSKQLTLLLFFKSLAIPAFYLVYAKLYGGIEKFDAGIFYHDVKAVNAFAKTDFKEYLGLLFGLQDDSPGSYIYEHCLIYTNYWDNGKIKDFFYNDNRVIIRLHSVLHFIAFNSYYVHALFDCFLSFTGIFFLYKSFKEFFKGKEVWLMLTLCLFPTLWFYTGALLKEGLTVFVMGCSVYQLKQVIAGERRLKNMLWLIILLIVSCFLKPYLLCFSALCFSLFFIIRRFVLNRFRLILFFSIISLFIASANILSVSVKHKSLLQAAFARQRVFADAAKGGIFLLDQVKFVRLEYDSTLIKRTGLKNDRYAIKKNVPYIYWEHSHQQDTLFCAANKDTLASYELAYKVPESGSNIAPGAYSTTLAGAFFQSLYYCLLYPFFFNAKGLLQLIASFENLAIVFALLVFLFGMVKSKKEKFLPLVFICFAAALCMLIGLTTPNSGAIFRYRSPVVIFILLAALYYMPVSKGRFFKDSK